MKKIIMLLIVLGLFFSFIPINIVVASDNPLNDGLVGYWGLDSSSGSVAIDSSPNQNDGNLINMEDEDWVTGKISNSLSFDGLDGFEYINCGNSSSFDIISEISLEAWVYLSAIKGMEVIIKQDVYSIHIVKIANKLYLGGEIFVNSINYGVQSSSSLNLNEWYHIVMLYQGSYIFLYLNGIQVGQSTACYFCSIDTNDNNVKIGGHYASFDGKVDELVIYNKALNQSEIDYRYNNGNGRGYSIDETPNNPPNKPICISPLDNSTNTLITTTLEVGVIDIDGDNMTVSFYLSDDTLIETVTDVLNNTYIETFNLSLNYNTTYIWYAVANDSYSETQSDIFTFITGVEEIIFPPITPSIDIDRCVRIGIVILLIITIFVYLLSHKKRKE